MSARTPRARTSSRTQLDFRGTMSGEALHGALALPDSVTLGGQTDWRAVLRMAPEPSRERSVRISSSLAGLELGLPAPLAKPAGSSMPTSVEVQWPANTTEVRIALASVVRGDLTLSGESGAAKITRAALWFGGGEPSSGDAPGMNMGGDIQELDLAGWLKLASSLKMQKPPAMSLRSAKLTVGQINYMGLAFRDVTLGLAQEDAGWRLVLDGPNVAGKISLPAAGDATAPWDLDFERLKFADSETGTAADEPDGEDGKGAIDPRSLPAIRFHARQLTWGDRQFGEVRADFIKVEGGLSLKQLTVKSASYGANATGEWLAEGGHLQGSITSNDVGETLKQLGFARVLEAKDGNLGFDLNWHGALSGNALSTATGSVQAALDKGQIVGLKPGPGRVLGLASFSELPRRLALDFSDLTDKGFAFDTVRGHFDLRDGSAYTDDFLVKGPAAEIGLIGRVGLKNKDYDQTAVVTGNVSGTLALPAFAAGPVVGGVVLLFTQVFKQPLKGLVRGYYRITGSWDNPTVERIKSADAATATAEAPKL